MLNTINSYLSYIVLPFWGNVIALVFIALSPLVIIKWRGKSKR